jgi:hypothetical protein
MKIYKILVITFFASLTFASISSAAENKNSSIDTLLKGLDLRHPIYGNETYGSPKADLFETADGSKLLAYQARYGGDGDHSANILKLFLITESASKKILEQNIDSVKFIKEKDRLKAIKGEYIETLCDVCDGWEVSDEEDIFKIPISISVDDLKITVELSKTQKKALIKKIDAQINKNISDKTPPKFGQTPSMDYKYLKYAESVKSRIINLLSNSPGAIKQ